MGGTYKAIGINLKGIPLGESDRLLTILTQEFGLIRAVAPGARKHKSKLGGRSGLFVINHLLLAKGRNLDKIVQAETIESYPGLSQDLGKLTAGQYLAELTLFQALSEQPQADLFALLNEHLSRLEHLPPAATLPGLAHATFHLLALAGVAPQVQACCLTQQAQRPDFTDPNWRIGFSPVAGGVVSLVGLERWEMGLGQVARGRSGRSLIQPQRGPSASDPPHRSGEATVAAAVQQHAAGSTGALSPSPRPQPRDAYGFLTATELWLLQHLPRATLLQLDGSLLPVDSAGPPPAAVIPTQAWLSIERILRYYAQFHFDRPIRSAALVDTCFLKLPTAHPHS